MAVRGRWPARGRSVVPVVLVLVAVGAVGLVGLVGGGTRRAAPVAAPVVGESLPLVGGRRTALEETGRGTGCGWSLEPSTPVAVGSAFAAARGKRATAPDFAYAFFDRHHDAEDVVRALAARDVRHYLGEATSGGLLTPAGVSGIDAPSLGLLATDLSGARGGIGAAEGAEALEAGDERETARLALLRAIEDAGEPADALRLVLFRTTGDADAVRGAIQEFTGPGVDLVGGRAATAGRGALVASGRVVEEGVVVAVFTGERRLPWCEAGVRELPLAVRATRGRWGVRAGLVLVEGTAGLATRDLVRQLAGGLEDLPWLGVVARRPEEGARSSALFLPEAAGERREALPTLPGGPRVAEAARGAGEG